MKRSNILLVSLFAILAFSVVAVASASAIEFLLAEALKNGAAITTAEPTDSEGELELIDLSAPIVGETSILCSFISDGTVNADGEGTITKLLTLAGAEVNGTALTAPGLVCTNTKNCGGTPEVWFEELPWAIHIELMLDAGTNFFVMLILSFKFAAKCTEAGISVQDLCSYPEVATELINEAPNVDVIFSDGFQELAGLKLGECSLGGAETYVINGLSTMLLTGGGTLTVSSE